MARIICDFQLPSPDGNRVHPPGALGEAAGLTLPGPSGQHLLPVFPGRVQPLLYPPAAKEYGEPSLIILPPTFLRAAPATRSQKRESPEVT